MNKMPIPRFLTSPLRAAGVLVASALCTTALSAADPEPVLHFDGIESIIQTIVTPEDFGVAGNNPRTVEAWVYTKSFSQSGVFHMGTSSTGDDGRPQEFALRTDRLNDRWLIQCWGADHPFTALGTGQAWAHMAIVYDGTELRAFVNGESVMDPVEADLNTKGGEWNFRIGAWRDQSFDGIIRDVRVWNVARTQAQIQAAMNDTTGLAGNPNLVGWWPIDEGSGRIAHDVSGNGYHGTIFAAQWESQQLDYDPEIAADFVMDFGTGPGQTDELGLVRNRPDHFSMESDSLRMTASTGNFVGSAASASVGNYEAGQNFVLESEAVLTHFPDARPSNIGLVVLGGPHEPFVSPFNAQVSDDYYTALFFPALTEDQLHDRFPAIESAGDATAVIAIAKTFEGPFIAAERWDGALPDTNTIFSDDFEDPATEADWVMGGAQNAWEMGTPTDPFKPALLDGSTRVAGTSLTATSPLDMNDYLRTPVIDLTGVTSAWLSYTEVLYLDFWINQETGEPYHTAKITVVEPDGTPIVDVATITSLANSWRNQDFLLPEAAYGQEVRIEFRVITDDFNAGGELYGWMIDDVEVLATDTVTYDLAAAGTYGFGGELDLSFTLTDGAEYSQTISAGFPEPIAGNLFGLGGRMQATSNDGPTVVDFKNLALTVTDALPLVPTTMTSAFHYPFGTDNLRVGLDSFGLTAEADWTLQGGSVQVANPTGTSLAVTRVREFLPGNSIHVETDAILSDLGSGGQAGLVLFGEEDPAIFSASDASTYYTFQYILSENKIALREGTDGTILYETAFPAPVEGATYRFDFTGSSDEGGLDFTATLTDGVGGEATLIGTLSGHLAGRNLFGLLAAPAGDVWDFRNVTGYTARPIDANYRFYRWVVQDTRSSSSFQLSEFTFFYEGEDLLAARRSADPEDVPEVSGPNEASENENPTKLVDGETGTKLFGGSNWSIPVIFDLGAPTRIDGYMLWTANDADGRDPTGWRLEGSLDTLSWDLIDARLDVEAPTARFARYKESGQFSLPTGAILNDFRVNGLSEGTIVTENGESVTFSWDTAFATSVNIQPDVGQVSAKGSLDFVVRPDSQTTYTLTAVGGDGVPYTATVTVNSVEPQTRTYRYVRFDVPEPEALRGNGNSIQIQQFQFYNDDTEVVPVDVSNPGGNMPANEPISNLIVSGPGKWLDFNKGTRAPGAMIGSYVVFDFGESVTIDSYRFITGNDATERDPLRWRLWGRDSEEAEWTLIENVVTNYAVTTARSTPTQIFPLPKDVTPTAGVIDRYGISAIGGDSIDLTSFVLVTDGTTLDLTWETAGTTSVSMQPVPGAVPASGEETGWLPPQGATQTIAFTASGEGGDTVETITIRSIPADQFETARYVRFDIPDNSALRNPNENSIQISEFWFFRNGERVPVVEVTNPGGNNPENGTQGPFYINDGDINSKWLDFNKANLNGSHLVFDFGEEPVEIDSYQFVTGGDASGRDPLRWRLYARNTPEEDWRLIESMPANFPVTTARNAETPIIPLPGLALTVPTAQPLSDWLDENFVGDDRTNPEISGLLADPAGDGVSNLLKYAFGLDPFTPVSSEDLPQAEVVNDTLRLTYVERIGATDITYTPQGSFTLTEWSSEGVVEVGPRVPMGEDFELVTVELPINAESRAFLRVQVTGAE